MGKKSRKPQTFILSDTRTVQKAESDYAKDVFAHAMLNRHEDAKIVEGINILKGVCEKMVDGGKDSSIGIINQFLAKCSRLPKTTLPRSMTNALEGVGHAVNAMKKSG